MAWHTALKQPIVPLCIEKPVLIKSSLLKTMIHISSQYKIVFALHKRMKCLIDAFRG